jgi:uncharacterized protein YecE (DUF72 family)
MRTHIGCSGWFYWHWRKTFYPKELPTHRWFRHYSSVFRTVELNAPFYRWPKPETVKRWKREAPRGFRYSIKVNAAITHERRLVGTKRLLKKFYGISEILGAPLGCFLFQFPPSFRFTEVRLKRVIASLDPRYQNAVEFRHRSWWQRKVYRAFERAGLIFCSVSGPRLPEELIQTGEILYLRFHGRSSWYRHDYSREELRGWAERIRASGATEAWIYFNNDRDGFAIKNARQLQRLLGVGRVRKVSSETARQKKPKRKVTVGRELARAG